MSRHFWCLLLLAGCESETLAPAGLGSAGPPKDVASARMPGPHRVRGDDAAEANARCVSCHAEEAEGWSSSRHHASGSNQAYRDALAIEPSSFCQSCHAPETDPRSMDPDPLGVGCVTCHVTTPGEVLASGETDELDVAGAPHPVRRSVEFADTGACASCHEFTFPMASGDADGDFMQTTIREHGRSKAANKACASCHMRGGSHSFADVRDPQWLRRHVSARAAIDEFGVTVTIDHRAGHAFPTGDLFRRVEVGAEVRDAAGSVLRRDVRWLSRRFEIAPGEIGRRLVRDDRVHDEPVETLLDVQAVPGAITIVWWVTYQRVAHTGDGRDPKSAVIESEVPLHGGAFSLSTRNEP